MFDNSDLLKSKPFNYQTGLAEEKKLAKDGSFTDEYFALQAYYAESLWQWMDSELSLMEMDAALAGSDLMFIPADKPVSVYQAHWSFGATYLFLRNNICIERLDDGELETLRALCSGGEPGSLEAAAFVMQTLRKTVSVYLEPDNEGIAYIYEKDGRSAPVFSIVLGLATRPERGENGELYKDPQHETVKSEALKKLAEEASARMTEHLGIPVSILIY